jgi:hypothetical protein
MQQSVLISSIRGADGLHKDHISKYILRWLRRCVLISAFEGKVLTSPTQEGGGSFTGPLKAEMIRDGDFACYESDFDVLQRVMKEYLRSTDEVPHHFHMHVLHAAEIIGYKHPTKWIKAWWNDFYQKLVSDAHLFPESEELMDRRLGDVEAQWKERELVPAADVPKVKTAPSAQSPKKWLVKNKVMNTYFQARDLEDEYYTSKPEEAYPFESESEAIALVNEAAWLKESNPLVVVSVFSNFSPAA